MGPAARCALGFAPHSGWAAAVAVGGTAALPRILARERIELADQHLTGSTQPYHAIAELPPGQARARLAALEASAARLASTALASLIGAVRAGGNEPCAAGIVDSSGRSGATLEAILASHALIHTADGNHFREALSRGCTAAGLPVTRIGRRELGPRAAAAFSRPSEELTAAVARLGRGLPPPWGADQKAAALIAWLLLVTASSARGR